MQAELPNLLFHGTDSEFYRPRAGGYDQVFWTAKHSTVAQNYIPQSGSRIHVRIPSYQLDEKVWPQHNDVMTAAAAAMGFVAQKVEWDPLGRAKSYAYPPQGWPTNREACEYLEKTLGYASSGAPDRTYEIKSDGWDAATKLPRLLEANHRRPGWLLIVSGHQEMKLYRMGSGEADLSDPQYHKLKTFARLANDGWDGVVIDDFAQSRTWGNVGHDSFGFFPGAIERLTIERIPAYNFDWGDDRSYLLETQTPELKRWIHVQKTQGARSLINRLRVHHPPITERASP